MKGSDWGNPEQLNGQFFVNTIDVLKTDYIINTIGALLDTVVSDRKPTCSILMW